MLAKRTFQTLVLIAVVIVFALSFGVWTVAAQGPWHDDDDEDGWWGMGGGMGMRMGGGHHGMMGNDHAPMMGGGQMRMGMDMAMMESVWTPPAELAPAGDALTQEEAQAIAEAYVVTLDDAALSVASVQAFPRHFMVTVNSGEAAAFMFSIDPTTGEVYSCAMMNQ